MAHSARNWKGARTPQAIKRDRQAARRHETNKPMESRARTLVTKALRAAVAGDAEVAVATIPEAESALDRAAKAGAIHANAAARRKSRLMRKVNAALGGATVVGTARATKTTGKAAAAKAAKARVATSRAAKAKGEQTAAGKARAAVHRATRGESGVAEAGVGAAVPSVASRRPAADKPATPRAPRSSLTTPGDKAASTDGAPKARAPRAVKAAPAVETKPARAPRTGKKPEA